MKKLKFLGIGIILFGLTGCLNSNSMDNINITTSVYPIEYVVNSLYGNHSTISSIYPKDDEVNTFKVTNVLLEQYSDTDLFIFNGISDEKNYVDKLNKINKNLKIIDVTSKMDYKYSIEELWLDPNNLLTIASKTKEGFEEYINSSYLTNEINENYEKLKIELTSLDGKYYSSVENANNKTIIVSDDAFKFLEKYGLTVVSIDPDTVKDRDKDLANQLISNGTCDYVFIKYLEDGKYVDSVINGEYEKLELYSMTNLNKVDIENVDYIALMNRNLEELKQELYK